MSKASERAVDVAHRLLRRHHRLDVEQAEPFGLADAALDALRIAHHAAEHLVAAADADDMAAAPHMGGKIAVPALARGNRARSAIVDFEPGMTTSPASAGSGSPGGTKTSSTCGSARSGSRSSKLAMRDSIGTAIFSAPALARRQPLEHDRILRRQQRRRLQPGHDAEAAPAGEALDRGDAVVEQA